MSDEHDGNEDPRFTALYHGVVVDDRDPKRIGRLKIRVPGMLEPSSGWCLPSASPGASPGQGFFFVPSIGAEVGVHFHQGDPDDPRYTTGNWTCPGGVPSIPTAAQGRSVDETPKVRCIETERWLILMDDNATTPRLSLVDKATEDGFMYDGLTRTMQIKSTVGLTIESLGEIQITGLAVVINGRPVAASSEPI